jgi:mannose-6-phosphate isomerase-like protein (cupin superfamily)
MSEGKVSATTAEHYTWGAGCDGSFLVRTPELHVIEERMPPETAEKPHHHTRARQFFYVVEGDLTMVLSGTELVLHSGEGLEIAPGELHQAVNRGPATVRFLVVSQPPSHWDRIDAEQRSST